MSTINELIKLQNYNVIEAKPLTVRGQYSKNTNTDTNKIIQSVSLLTTELNNISSNIKQSSLNNSSFSLKQWVNNTKNVLINNALPSINSNITNSKPLTNNINLIKESILLSVNISLNQSEVLINKLENQVYLLIDKQKNVKIEKDTNGNITLIPILSSQSQNSINNIKKILTSISTNLTKINNRLSNDKSITSTDDILTNLSLKHVLDFTQSILSVMLLIRQIKNIRKNTQAAVVVAELSVPASVYTNAGTLLSNIALNSEKDQQQLQDLEAAFSTVNITNSQIIFYSNLILSLISKINKILELINNINLTQSQINEPLENLNQIQNNIQQIIDNSPNYNQIEKQIEIIKTNNIASGYAAKIEK